MIFQDFVKVLQKHQKKVTEARVALFEVASASNTLFTVQELRDQFLYKNYSTHLATLYRDVELFRDLGIFREITFARNKAHYFELVSSVNDEASVFMICEKCNKVTVLCTEKKVLSNEIKEKAAKADFFVKHTRIKVYGLCHPCLLKQGKYAAN